MVDVALENEQRNFERIVPPLKAEVERLQLQRAGLLEQCSQQTERLTTWEADAHRLRAQLAAALAAKDEACDLALHVTDYSSFLGKYVPRFAGRLAQLRQVGKPEGK